MNRLHLDSLPGFSQRLDHERLPPPRPAGIRGGEARQIGVGDFVVIPAGTLHWFSQINGSITYVNIRLAP